MLAREMTKLHEEFLRGSLSDITTTLNQRDTVKGECTLLVAGADSAEHHDEEEIEAAIRMAVEAGVQSLSVIAKELAARFNRPRKSIYDKALRYRQETPK